MDAAMQQQLNRLAALTEMQLYEVLTALDDDLAPQYIKDLIARKINSILNQRLGLEK